MRLQTLHQPWGTSTSVSTGMGDHQGRPGAVYLGPFVGVNFSLWSTDHIAVIELTRKLNESNQTCAFYFMSECSDMPRARRQEVFCTSHRRHVRSFDEIQQMFQLIIDNVTRAVRFYIPFISEPMAFCTVHIKRTPVVRCLYVYIDIVRIISTLYTKFTSAGCRWWLYPRCRVVTPGDICRGCRVANAEGCNALKSIALLYQHIMSVLAVQHNTPRSR